MDVERELRQSLARIEPQPGFAGRVMARADERERKAALWQQWQWAAACLVLCAVMAWPVHREWRQRQEGIAARDRLMQALRVTAVQLNVVKQKVQDLHQ